ncbi:MAG: hypothetical protein V1652_03925 [bacterium]
MQPIKIQVPEFEKHTRSIRWHISTGIIGGLMAIFAWLTGNYAFIAFLGIAALALVLADSRIPRTVPFVIEEKTITFDKKKWLLADIQAFSLLERDDETAYLILHPKENTFAIAPPRIIVTHPKIIQTCLRTSMKEVHYEESFMEILARLLGL